MAEAPVWKLAILVKCGEEAGDVGNPEEEEEEGGTDKLMFVAVNPVLN